MLTIKIYKITITAAPQIAERDTHFALEPWGVDAREYKGYDDGGKYYVLPDKYSVGKDAAGSLRLYDIRDLEVVLTGVEYPAIINGLGLPERLAVAPETEAERKARCLKQSADVKRILGGYRAPQAKRKGMTAGQFMATFSNQGGVR